MALRAVSRRDLLGNLDRKRPQVAIRATVEQMRGLRSARNDLLDLVQDPSSGIAGTAFRGRLAHCVQFSDASRARSNW